MSSQQRPVKDSIQAGDQLYTYDNLNGMTAVVPVSVLTAYLASITPPPAPPVAGDPFAGYTYVDETASRAFDNTVYTNSTGKAIQVIADIGTNTDGNGKITLSGTVDGIGVAVFGVYTHNTGTPPPSHSINFWVPSGSTYSVNVTGGPATFSTNQWLEFK